MILYLDTNILLNHFLNRDDGVSTQLLNLVVTKKVKAYINSISISTCYYLLNKINPKLKVEEDIEFLLDVLSMVPCTEGVFRDSLKLKFKDYEDAVQATCALKSKSSFIVSNNLEDFKKSPVQAISPKIALDLYNSSST